MSINPLTRYNTGIVHVMVAILGNRRWVKRFTFVQKALQGMLRLFTISLQLTKTTYLVSHLDQGCDWGVVQITGQIVSFSYADSVC